MNAWATRVYGLCVLPALMLAGCGDSLMGTFVGRADESDVLLGIVSNGVKVRAYACDGASITEWFNADPLSSDAPLLSASGAQLTVRRGGSPVAELNLGEGRVLTIQTLQVDGAGAGVFRAERTAGDTNFVGGWVVLPDGTQRGAVTGGAVTVFGAVLDLDTLTTNIQGLGSLQAVQLTPGTL